MSRTKVKTFVNPSLDQHLNLGDSPKPIEFKPVSARSINQKLLIKSILDNAITIANGVPGCGKTHISVGMGVELLEKKLIDKIVITRPAIESYERLGFLPGDIQSKMAVYLQPIYDEFLCFMDKKGLNSLIENGTIEIIPMGFLRGRNLKSYVILDESQNCVEEQLKLFLTRLCPTGKMVLTGDPSQSDLPAHLQGGFTKITKALQNIEGIGVVYLDKVDTVRHPLVPIICDVFDELERPRQISEFFTGDKEVVWN